MDLAGVSFFVGLMIVPVVYFFARKMLLKAKYLNVTFSIAGVLAMIGLTQVKNETGGKPNFYLFLFCPLCSLIIFRLLLFCFKKIKRRDPRSLMDIPSQLLPDDDGLWSDRMFHFIFLTTTMCGPLFLLAYYYP
jgi:hypothetical protein